jgi:hypothetical protein
LKTRVVRMSWCRLGAAVIGAVLLSSCNPSPPEAAASEPKRWEESTAGGLASDIAAVDAAALRGDERAVRENLRTANDNFRRSMKLPDPAKPVDPELARTAAKRIPGVRSAVWLDRENLFVIVERNEQKSQQTIDAICLQLEPLGDTLAVVVNVQSGAAKTGDELEILSRNCQLAPGDRAFLQRNRQVDALAPAARAQHRANNLR